MMLDTEIILGDNMIENKLLEKSNILNISLEELTNRYIKFGLFEDDYYVPRQLTREELIEMSKRDVERDKKRGIPPKKHNFDVFIGMFDKSD